MNDRDIATIDRCWKEIGVWGPDGPQCPELEKVTHCRNCKIYIQAGRSLLERQLPDVYRQECTEVLAEKKVIEAVDTLSLVIFRIASEWFALPTRIFAEVTESVSCHTVPHRRNSVLIGIVNVHGEIHLCVSLQALFALDNGKEGEDGDYQRMMVINKDSEKWVFPVDHIHGICRLNPDMLQNAPANVSRADSTFTRSMFSWEGRHVSLLDEELLVQQLTRSVK